MADEWARRSVVATVVALALIIVVPSSAFARDPTATWSQDGSKLHGMDAGKLRTLGGRTHNAVNAPPKPPWYKYGSSSYCSDSPPGASGGGDPSCTQEFAVCRRAGASNGASGPAVRVWQMEVGRTGAPVPGATWTEIGWTCLSDLVPGANNVLTMQMILNEFHKTTFAKPTTSIQPVGLKTLVNLPTFYELKWNPTGFEPGEGDSTVLVGRQVEIEPVFVSATYIYGDGEASGPVKSFGGPHPDGDVIHTYRKKMVAPVQINATYGGRFRVDGGAWIDIPDTVTIEGVPVNLTVAEAKARLYNNGG